MDTKQHIIAILTAYTRKTLKVDTLRKKLKDRIDTPITTKAIEL